MQVALGICVLALIAVVLLIILSYVNRGEVNVPTIALPPILKDPHLEKLQANLLGAYITPEEARHTIVVFVPHHIAQYDFDKLDKALKSNYPSDLKVHSVWESGGDRIGYVLRLCSMSFGAVEGPRSLHPGVEPWPEYPLCLNHPWPNHL